MFNRNNLTDFNDILELIRKKKEDEFIEWMKEDADDETLQKLNTALTQSKVNLFHFLLTHYAFKAFDETLTRNIGDITGSENKYFEYQKTTALLERAKALISSIQYEKAAKEDIENAKKLIDHGSNVNVVCPPNKHASTKLPPEKLIQYYPMGETALMSYALVGCTEMVKYVLEHGGSDSINTRNFSLLDLNAYCHQESEATVAPQIAQTDEGYRFETALTLAFQSNRTHDGEIIKLLLDHGADLTPFYDNEFYRPILFSAVASSDPSIAHIRPECRTKVEMIVKKMEQENLHLSECKETYRIFTEMLSDHGYRFKRGMCAIL